MHKKILLKLCLEIGQKLVGEGKKILFLQRSLSKSKTNKNIPFTITPKIKDTS